MTRFLAMGVLLLSTASAMAADIPFKGRPISPVVVPVYSWTGFYVGGNLGWGWTDGDGTIAFGGLPGPINGEGNGVLGGLQLGYNWQAGSIVLGVEADIQASGGEGDINAVAGGVTLVGTSKIPWFATFRGRLGYALDQNLLYVTGGAVYGDNKLDGTLSTIGPFSTSQSFWTWTVGGGWERALLGRWTGKIEYLYVGTPNEVAVPPGTTSLTGSISTHVVRAGVNYRF